jgi:hypothetical protein
MTKLITITIAIAALSYNAAFAEMTPDQTAAFGVAYLESVDSIVNKYSNAESVNLSTLRPEAREQAIALLSETSDYDPEDGGKTEASINRMTNSMIELASSLLGEKGVKVNNDLPKNSGLGANVLFRAYDQNPIAADAKYRYKTKTIVGTVRDIGRDILGNPYIVMGDDRIGIHGVQCIFSTEDEAEISKLKKRQPVAVEGEVKGLVLFNVLIENCKFVEMPPKDVIPAKKEIRRAVAATTATAAQNPNVDLERFVNAYIQSGASDSESALMEAYFYSDQVDYFDHGIVDRAFIVKDIRDYASRWTYRSYAIDDGIELVMINPRTMRAQFRLTYTVSNNKKTIRGTVESILLIDITGHQPEIISAKSKTIDRHELVASK